MARRSPFLLVALVLLLAGCDGDDRTGTGTTTPTETSTTGMTAPSAFFYRNAALEPVAIDAPDTNATARAVLERLLEGPPAGYTTSIPKGVRLVDLAIAGGVARARFSRELGEPPRTAQAQIVSSLTQLPGISAASIEVEGQGPIPLEDGSGRTLGGQADTEDYIDLTADAPIFVRTPLRDSVVSSPVVVAGTANVFEGTIQMEIRSGGVLRRAEVITATAGSGERGTWEKKVELPEGEVEIVLYEASAEDGSALHETRIPLTVR